MKGYNFRILQCSLLIDIENQKKKNNKVCDRQGASPFRLFFRLSYYTFRNLEHYKKKTKQEI